MILFPSFERYFSFPSPDAFFTPADCGDGRIVGMMGFCTGMARCAPRGQGKNRKGGMGDGQEEDITAN
jgi:hypothetical protein